MKVTPKEDIKAKGRLFEANAPFDSVKQDLDDETIERWYSMGWVEIEGRDPSPERRVTGVVVRPNNTNHEHKESNHG